MAARVGRVCEENLGACRYTRTVMTELRATRRMAAPRGRETERARTRPGVRRTGWREAIATGLLAALIAYLALTPLAPFARDPAASEARRHVVLGVVLAVYPAWLLLTRRAPISTPLDLPLILVLVAVTLGVARAPDPRASLEAVLPLLPVFPLALIVADGRLVGGEAVRRGVMIAAVAVGMLALASVWRQWAAWLELVYAVEGVYPRALFLPPSVPRVEGVGSHPNIAGALLAMALPFFPPSLTARPRAERALAVAGLVVVIAGLFFTLARSAWAAAVAGLLVAATLTAFSSGLPRLRPGRNALVGAAVLLVLLVGAVALVGRSRPEWLFRDSLGPRADMRRAGIEVARDHPLTGAGPGAFASLYPEHKGAYPFAAVHAHNIPVQIAVEYGLVGLGAGAALALTAVVALALIYKRGDETVRRAVALAAGTGTAFAVHGLADSTHLFPEALALLACALGIAWRTRAGVPARPSPLRSARSVAPALMLGMGLALLPAWWTVDRASALHERSVTASARGDRDAAVQDARRAVQRDPRLMAYRLQLGAALAARYGESRDTADRDAAIAAYRRALVVQPRIGAAWVDLAALLLDRGDTDGARVAGAEVQRRAGRDPLLQLAGAVIVQRTEPAATAVETYAGLLALNPALALTPFWRDDPFRAQHYDAIVDRALHRTAEITGEGAGAESLRIALRVFTGRATAGNRTMLTPDELPGDTSSRVALGRLLLAGGRRDEAEEVLRGAVQRTRDSADARSALGDLYAASGDTARARREWLIASYLDDPHATNALGESYRAGGVPEAVIKRQRHLLDAASIARFYLPFQTFRFTFGRHEPVPIIAAGDWLDALPDGYTEWSGHLDRWQAEKSEGQR